MSQNIKLIVGLGNPGQQYAETRHNVGVWFVEQLLEHSPTTLKPENKFKGLVGKISLHGHECFLLIPTTFMNLSGEAVGALAKFYKILPQEILVAHDELDLPPGEARIKQGGGHGGHNGLKSIFSHLSGNRDFLRLRIGIGHPGESRLVSDYVLKRPSKHDEQLIDNALSDADRVFPLLLEGQIQKAMTQLHTQ